MRTFRSDNNAGICQEALDAFAAANQTQHQVGYGDDDITHATLDVFESLFDCKISTHFVATGTAANTLALASMTDPWQRILCHDHSHLNDDESTAPERLTHCRITPIITEVGRSKLTTEDILHHVKNSRGDVHQPSPGVLSISNPTEFGEVYNATELQRLCDLAHAYGYRMHVDGARFANAVASLDCQPNDIAGDAGVDALSFGGTKNGMAFGEAVLFFPQGDDSAFDRASQTFEHHRKGTGHLLSKHRFIAAQFQAMLHNDVWLKHARHANTMARQLSDGLRDVGLDVRYATDANGVFVVMPGKLNEELQRRGHEYYMFGDASWNLARLMCSFDTDESEIEQFLVDVREHA